MSDLTPVTIEREDVEGALKHLEAIALSLGAAGRIDFLVQEELRDAAGWLTGSPVRPMTVLAVAGYLMMSFERIAQDRVDGVAPLQFTDEAFALVRTRLLG